MYRWCELNRIVIEEVSLATVRSEELLTQLKIDHRDFDEVVEMLIESKHPDEGIIHRFKKRKLHLRDQISKLERQRQAS